jgi:hypothetical protein
MERDAANETRDILTIIFILNVERVSDVTSLEFFFTAYSLYINKAIIVRCIEDTPVKIQSAAHSKLSTSFLWPLKL